MSKCIDNRYGQMLHHYELGLLADQEQSEMEQHLLDCQFCWERLERFSSVAEHLRNSPGVRSSVDGFAKATVERDRSIPSREPSRSGPARRYAWAAFPLLAVILVTLLVLKDWRIDIVPSDEAGATESRVAVFTFDNLADSEDVSELGTVVANLLITDLSNSGFLRVISHQRIGEIARAVGMAGEQTMPKRSIIQIAERAKADLVLSGTVLQTEPRYTLSFQLLDVATGDVIASHRVEGQIGESIFSVVDRLTPIVKSTLNLPEDALDEADPQIAEITTGSLEAYRRYLEGVRQYNDHHYDEATAAFEQALKHDSTMAMAYYYLTFLVDSDLIGKAIRYSDRISRTERLYIQSLSDAIDDNLTDAIDKLRIIVEKNPDQKRAHYLLGFYYYNLLRVEEAITHLGVAVEIDPRYKSAYHLLAMAYDANGDYEHAIVSACTYESLAPNDADPHYVKGIISSHHGKLSEAMRSFETALDIKPDFHAALTSVTEVYLHSGNYALADSCCLVLSQSPNYASRAAGRIYSAYVPILQGRFASALDLIMRILEAERADTAGGGLNNMIVLYHLKSRILAEQGLYPQALETYKHSLIIGEQMPSMTAMTISAHYVQLLSEAKALDSARSEADALKQEIDDSELSHDLYWYAAGCVDFHAGDMAGAVENLERAAASADNFPTHFMLARAYLESGKLAPAVSEFEKQLANYTPWRLCWGIWSVKMHYYLGRAYEMSGWLDEAAQQYSRFCEIWKDADPGIPVLTDARERLARLKTKP